MITVARRPEVTPWVLVVDDDPIAARAIARIVSGRIGASVSVVADADAALHLVTHASEAPVAAILDYDLRGGQKGLTVLLGFRAAGFDVPCAFHTGAPDQVRAALDLGLPDDGCPVFEKGSADDAALLEWVASRLQTDTAHASGVRRKLI